MLSRVIAKNVGDVFLRHSVRTAQANVNMSNSNMSQLVSLHL